MGLTLQRIVELSKRKGVRKIGVENFLMSMFGVSKQEAYMNMKQDAAAYKWNHATQEAIRIGINEHFRDGGKKASNG